MRSKSLDFVAWSCTTLLLKTVWFCSMVVVIDNKVPQLHATKFVKPFCMVESAAKFFNRYLLQVKARTNFLYYVYFAGYLTSPGVLPAEAPENPEPLENILKDVDKYIMPGVSST